VKTGHGRHKGRRRRRVRVSGHWHFRLLVLKRIAICKREVFKRRIFFSFLFLGDSISLSITVGSPHILSKEETMKIWLDSFIGPPPYGQENLDKTYR
jgi:hypothetical protein